MRRVKGSTVIHLVIVLDVLLHELAFLRLNIMPHLSTRVRLNMKDH
jgi:hypothetical protein